MPDCNYEHLTVNHSKEFVTKDGVHTNAIEGSWAHMKAKTPSRKYSKDLLQGHLFEFLWRNQHSQEMWHGLLSAMASVRYQREELDREMQTNDSDDGI